MKRVGISLTAISALVARGADFDRAKLDAMLDRLARAPEPKSANVWGAMCYVMARPPQADYDYVCRICGTRTLYKNDRTMILRRLEPLRAAAVRLRGKGLVIELDESCMCIKCGRDIVPTGGEVVCVPASPRFKDRFPWKVGDKIVIKGLSFGLGEYGCRFDPVDPEYWVFGKYITSEGVTSGDAVRVRLRPDVESPVFGQIRKGVQLSVLPRRDGDPDDWVRIERPRCWPVETRGMFHMSPHYVGNFRYGETPGYVFRYDRLEWLRWKINGKCVFVRENDELILEAFLDGASVVSLPRDRTAALKSFLPRLRYLLQGVPEKEDEVDMWTPGGKDRSHANGRDRSHADIDVKVEVGL